MTDPKTFATESKRRPLIREKPAPVAYRINDAAEAIGIGRSKLYELIMSGKIPAKKCDGITYIRAVDLHAYIMGGEDVGPLSSMPEPEQ